MQIENIKISPAEVKNFPTALKWRRHAFGMDYDEVAELLGGGYTSLQVYSWEAGMELPLMMKKPIFSLLSPMCRMKFSPLTKNIFTTSRPVVSPRRRRSSAPQRKRTTRLFIAKWLKSCR